MNSAIREAMKFAAIAHDGQYRRDGVTPYFTHCIDVYCFMQSKDLSKGVSPSNTSLIAGILHDTIEDTKVTLKDIEDKFGALVASYVGHLSNNPQEVKRIGKAQHQLELMKNMPDPVLRIKLADIYANAHNTPTRKWCEDKVYVLAILLHTSLSSIVKETVQVVIKKVIEAGKLNE